MTEPITPADGPAGFEVRLDGHLDDHWHHWVPDLTMTHETDGTTSLRAPGLDQSALHGLLSQVRDLGATLISVAPLERCPRDGDPPSRHHRATSTLGAANAEPESRLGSQSPHDSEHRSPR